MMYPWILAGSLGALLIVQALVMRRSQQRRLAELQGRHTQYQREVNGKFESMKRQIIQLTAELNGAKQRLQDADEAAAVVAARMRVDPVAAREALELELAAGEAALHEHDNDGFADTQVSMHDTDDSLLLG